MKLAITLAAAVAAMGFAAATPAQAHSTGPNSCTYGAVHFNFVEMHCTHDYPWWYTPVSYVDTGGGDAIIPEGKKHYCPPPPPCRKPTVEID